MRVIELIDHEMYEFYRNTGEYPNTVYLDSANHDLFVKEAEETLCLFPYVNSLKLKLTNERFPTPWYRGMSVFKVMTNTYHVNAVKL